MKRYWLFLLAIALAIALPRAAWADVEIVKTADGTTFKFGLHQKFQVFSNRDHDLTPDFNFRSFISPDVALGGADWAAQNFANLTFTLERGPLRIHANIEQEMGIDANAVDINNVNLERFVLAYKFANIGTLHVGFDVRALDPEGGLIYTDEHPGIWLTGGDDDFSWDIGWHRVQDCQRGAGLFNNNPAFCDNVITGTGNLAGGSSLDNNKDDYSDLFANRLNIAVADGWTVSPLLVYYRRHQPQTQILNEFSDPTGNTLITFGPLFAGPATPFPTGTIPTRDPFQDVSFSDQFRPGAVIKGTLGALTLTFQGAGQLGEIQDLPSTFMGGKPIFSPTTGALLPTVADDYDLRAFAFFFEVALDGDEIGMEGFTPYLNFEFMSGDDDPFDDQYQGYVPISNLTAALRKDGFKGQSISSFGPPVLGANSQDGWGFDTSARGNGPSIGGILPDETNGAITASLPFLDNASFNNRGGKASNPGHFKLSVGTLGKFADNWDTHIGISSFWYHNTETIEAEAAQSCIARELASLAATGGFGATPFPCGTAANPLNGVVSPFDDGSVRAAQQAMRSGGLDLDKKFMGVEINANVGYTTDGGLRIQPFISIFVPGDIVEETNHAFLSTGSAGTTLFGPNVNAKDSRTGVAAGVEISASF